MPVVVSPEALADLASIRAYLAERNPVAAIALTMRLSDAMFSLEDMLTVVGRAYSPARESFSMCRPTWSLIV